MRDSALARGIVLILALAALIWTVAPPIPDDPRWAALDGSPAPNRGGADHAHP